MSPTFEITFYREILGDNGRCRNEPIEVVEITQATNEEAAIARAIRCFEAEKGVRCWSSLATHFAVCARP